MIWNKWSRVINDLTKMLFLKNRQNNLVLKLYNLNFNFNFSTKRFVLRKRSKQLI